MMFKKKKKKKKPNISIGEISKRLRGFILDSQIQNAHELCVILGCSIMSDELQEREEDDSDLRVERISYLVPMLYAHAHALAEGSVEYQKTSASEDLASLPDELWLESRKMMEQIALSALMGSVSQLIDMGLLHIPKEHK